MKNEVAKHIIHRVNVDVEVPDISIGRHIHSNIRDCLYSSVLPAVEAELDKVIAGNKFYRTDSITIDVLLTSRDELERSLAQIVAHQVNIQLGELMSTKQTVNKDGDDVFVNAIIDVDKIFEQKSSTEKRWEIFIEFLKTGRLPWFAGSANWLDEEILIDQLSNDNKQIIQIFKKALAQYPIARQRLVKQFSTEFVFRLIEKQLAIPLSHYLEKVKNVLLNTGFERRYVIEKEFVLKVLKIIISDDVPELTIKSQLEAFLEAITIPAFNNVVADEGEAIQIKPDEKLEVKKKRFIPFEEDGLFVANAGLVLLHPFLQYFFMEFQLIKENVFIDQATQQTAIHLLHYLATGKEQPYEYDLTLEKYFCGLSADEPVERFITLSSKMKEESNNLLKAAIHHWKVLKNTSAQGLQEGFLQRNGKLILSPHQRRLIVETNTIDILLDQLPWGYSIVQLPWMQQILYVDWITS